MSGEDDEIVAELDVYLCKGTLPEGSKMYLLQSPLRPPWRPYDLDSAEEVQMKPLAGRLQVDLPLAQAGPNVNKDAEPAKQMPHLRLVSSPAALPTSFAIGVVRDNKLLLVPVDEALQLRPSLAHLNKPAAAPGGASADADEEDVKPELQAVKVSVQRRETERQAEARLKSYSHHAKQETEEPWVKLSLHSADSEATMRVWDKLTKPPDAKVDMSLSRADYLESVVPGSGIVGAGTGGSGWRGGDGPQPMDLGAPDAAPQQAGYPAAMPMQSPAVDPEAQVLAAAVPAVQAAVSQLLTRHSVINLNSIRRHLRHSRDQRLQQAATAGDRHLGELLKAQPDVTVVCGKFVATPSDGRDDELKRVVLQLMQDPEPVKRADVAKAAKAAGIEWVDSAYHRVMKALGKNSNNTWTLQDGDID